MRRNPAAARLGALVGALLLAGCSSEGQSDFGAYFQIVRESFKGNFGSGGVTRGDAAAIPYATMGVRVDGGHESLIVLATQTESTLLWTSRARVVVETTAGRITRTVGLPNDVSAVTPLGVNRLTPPAQALVQPFDSRRTMDFPNENRFGVEVTCHAAARGKQRIVILGHPIPTVQVKETCRGQNGWNFEDIYWIDKDSGFVWKSLQHLHPKGQTVALQIFRPPG